MRTSACSRPICRTASSQRAVTVPTIADELLRPEEPIQAAWAGDPCGGCGTVGCETVGCGKGCSVTSNHWARLEYALWWREGRDLPPLVTTSTDGTVQSQAGVLGLDSTSVLFGGRTVGENARPGGRVSIGTWLDPWMRHAVEGRFFILSEEAVAFEAQSTGTPILARPFLNVAGANPIQGSRLLAFDGVSTNGSVQIRSESNVLGGDFLYRRRFSQLGSTRVDFLAGYQFARIDENLTISDFTEAVDIPPLEQGTTMAIEDSFETRNEFHGGLIGLGTEFGGASWRLELLAKIAFGNMREVVKISGQTTVVTPDPNSATSVTPVGLLAQGNNVGRYARNTFAVSPELNVNFVYSLSECIELTMGYSYIYWSDAVQPGNQIDDLLAVPPSTFVFDNTDFALHGLNAGLEFRF
ncbi:MAG: BBP7 family outer membrane beta-barrel protein [Pirellulaceae bacterium]